MGKTPPYGISAYYAGRIDNVPESGDNKGETNYKKSIGLGKNL